VIIVSITGPTQADALSQVRGSARWADIIEFRLDMIAQPDLHGLFVSTRKPRIATLRPDWEGGCFQGSEEERLDILLEAGALGAEYIDIEHAVARRALRKLRRHLPHTKFIVSSHRDRVGVSGGAAYRVLKQAGGDIVKWAYTARDSSDLRRAIDFLAAARKDRARAVAIAMGEVGEPSRILYRKFGGWATYASAETGPESAPGQLPASVLKKVYRAHTVTPNTQVFGVLGNPLRQSKGIYVHNALFQRARRRAVYVRFPARNLSLFMRNVMPFLGGCSVTLPFKEKVGTYCTRIEENAVRIGAINTLFRRGRTLIGLNTDAAGALDAIEAAMTVKGRSFLVVGAGGAARAIVYEANRRGASVYIVNRDPARARALALEFGATVINASEISSAHFDILANATSVGMFPAVDSSPVPRSILRPGMVVFDAVYSPPLTRLLREAREAGAQTVSGLEMYLNQAARQSKLFAGRAPDRRLMKRTLEAHL
jgi:3-dehydroquinate dehydratase/shikimate dehydrogenase